MGKLSNLMRRITLFGILCIVLYVGSILALTVTRPVWLQDKNVDGKENVNSKKLFAMASAPLPLFTLLTTLF